MVNPPNINRVTLFNGVGYFHRKISNFISTLTLQEEGMIKKEIYLMPHKACVYSILEGLPENCMLGSLNILILSKRVIGYTVCLGNSRWYIMERSQNIPVLGLIGKPDTGKFYFEM